MTKAVFDVDACHRWAKGVFAIPLTVDQIWQRLSLTLVKDSTPLTLVKGGTIVLPNLTLTWSKVLLIAVKAVTRVKCLSKVISKVLSLCCLPLNLCQR